MRNRNLELFFNLEIDYEPLHHRTTRLSEKPNQIISFTFPGSPHRLTIQYTENVFLNSGKEVKKLMGIFFLEEQPFQLFKFSEKYSSNNSRAGGFSLTESVLVDTLPCTALISKIQKSNYRLKLLQSDPDVFGCTLKDGVSGDAYIGYEITYWFNLKSLIAICKTSENVDTST
jgi:hypothetical protein